MLHHRDIVEEIATQRQGEIDAVDQYILESEKRSPRRWRVRFLDGREPRFPVFRAARRLAPYSVSPRKSMSEIACLRQLRAGFHCPRSLGTSERMY